MILFCAAVGLIYGMGVGCLICFYFEPPERWHELALTLQADIVRFRDSRDLAIAELVAARQHAARLAVRIHKQRQIIRRLKAAKEQS